MAYVRQQAILTLATDAENYTSSRRPPGDHVPAVPALRGQQAGPEHRPRPAPPARRRDHRP